MSDRLAAIVVALITSAVLVSLQFLFHFALSETLWQFSSVTKWLSLLIVSLFVSAMLIVVAKAMTKHSRKRVGFDQVDEGAPRRFFVKVLNSRRGICALLGLSTLVISVSTVLVIERGIPFLSSFPRSRLRVVIAKFTGPDYKDFVGESGLVKSIVGEIKERISARGMNEYLDIDYTYLPVHNITQAEDVAKRYRAALIVWGTWESSEGDMRISLKLNPIGGFWFMRGNTRVYYQAEMPFDRLEQTSRLIRNKLDLIEHTYLLARFLSLFAVSNVDDSQKRLEFARATWTELHSRFDLEIDYLLNIMLGNELSLAGEYDKAIPYFNEALGYLRQFEPKNQIEIGDCLGHLSFLNMRLGRTILARELMKQALKSAPDLYRLTYLDGILSYQEGSATSLQTVAKRATVNFPDSVEMLDMIGTNLLRLGEPRSGLSLLMRVDSLKGDTNSAFHYYLLGGLAYVNGDVQLAERMFRESLNRDHCFAQSRHRFAVLLYCQDRYKDALSLIDCEPIKNTFDQNELLRYRFLCQLGLGWLDSAETSIALYLDSTTALSNRSWSADRRLLDQRIQWTKELQSHLRRIGEDSVAVRESLLPRNQCGVLGFES